MALDWFGIGFSSIGLGTIGSRHRDTFPYPRRLRL
jgi:hypothetical protein